MEQSRTIVGRLDRRGILPIVELAHAELWTGELRLKHGDAGASVWMVNGEILHARLSGDMVREGLEAFDHVSSWFEGEYILQAGILPPDRSIRVSSLALLKTLRDQISKPVNPQEISGRSTVVGRSLLQVLDGLRERVPGLESLSVMRGPVFEATTSHSADEMEWMDHQLQAFFASDQQKPDALYIREGGHTLLILNHGVLSTVLSARNGTTPEALFWAGAEAQRRVLESADTLLPTR